MNMDELAYKATKFLNIQDDIKHGKGVLQKKPVSAMKGTRHPAKQLTVKWAPDVYDPVVPCSTVVVVIKRPRKKNGENSKEKNNGGKSSQGSKSKGKDKKQKSRKRGGELL